MTRKKKKNNNLDHLFQIIENNDLEGVAVILLGKDGTITIGSDGLDADTTQNLLRQSVSLLSNESGVSQTIH